MAAPSSRQITLNVTDPDLIAEIDSWIDGEPYSFEVTQTAANTFEVTDAYGDEAPAEAAAPSSPTAANGANPAISNLLGRQAA